MPTAFDPLPKMGSRDEAYKQDEKTKPDEVEDWFRDNVQYVKELVNPEEEAKTFMNTRMVRDAFNYGDVEAARDAAGQKVRDYQNRAPFKFDEGFANSGRQAQLEFLKQLDARGSQDFTAGLEGQKALNKSARKAAMMNAQGGGLAGARAVNQEAQDIPSQVGEQGMHEQYRQQNLKTLMATQARAQDLAIQNAVANADLTSQQLNNAMVQYYTTLGMDLNTAVQQADIEKMKLYQGRRLRNDAQLEAFKGKIMQVGAMIAGGIAGGGAGGSKGGGDKK